MQPKGVIKGQETQNIIVIQNISIIRAYCSPVESDKKKKVLDIAIPNFLWLSLRVAYQKIKRLLKYKRFLKITVIFWNQFGVETISGSVRKY